MKCRPAALLLAVAIVLSTSLGAGVRESGAAPTPAAAQPLPARSLVGGSSAAFPFADRAQRVESRYGDKAPFQGGARILLRKGRSGRYSVCSAGLPVRGRDGREYMLTAGHCAPAGGARYAASTGYVSRGVGGPQITVLAAMGRVTSSAYVEGSTKPQEDLALIRTNTVRRIWHGNARWPAQSVPLAGFGTVKPGMRVCHGGASSGRSCSWRVERLNVTVRYSERGRRTFVRGLVMARRVGPALLRDGDSGGPVYGWSPSGRAYAYGVVSGGSGDDLLFFAPVNRAVARWGLRAS